MDSCHYGQSNRTLSFLALSGPVLRSAVLEDCVLCQEAISSSEVAAKAREGHFEGQITHKQPPESLNDGLIFLEAGQTDDRSCGVNCAAGSPQILQIGCLMRPATLALPAKLLSPSFAGSTTVGAVGRFVCLSQDSECLCL